MKKLSFILIANLLVILLFYQGLKAQSLYMPRNVKAAFEKGTRSMDGKPGPHYWQNHGKYNIELTVTPPNRIIKGSEQITYFNDSPDTLKTIVFNLFMNFHKPGAVHYFSMDTSVLTSGIHIDHFAINRKTSEWHDPNDHYTWQNVNLTAPLLPGDSIHFSIKWDYEIASVFNGANHQLRTAVLRTGVIDSTTYSIAYFYPRIAVYDDYNGWNRLEFTGAQEFYNDFNNYTLRVRVPANFIVWATGTLQNQDEVLQSHYAQLLKKSMTSDNVIHIVTSADLKQKNITVQNAFNTWIWKADDITDMALFVSNHDDWDAASVVVNKKTGRRASVQAAYNDTATLFQRAVAIGQKALSFLSQKLPGVPYPYRKMTEVLGYSGMEYPMMANDGFHDPYSKKGLNAAINEENHEIAHTYFPFYMGTDESRYAFMDEGWATFFAFLIAQKMHRSDYLLRKVVRYWLEDHSQEEQQPIIAVNVRPLDLPYVSDAYTKPSLAYLALNDLLGDQLFKKCLQGYIARWQGKHPIPWDFFNAFNNISGKNLNWFWNSWFFSHGYDDLGVGKVIKTKDGYAVTVKNIGGIVIPFDIKINYSDESKGDIHETPIVWKKNEKQTTIAIKTKKKISSLTIDNGIWMDANEKDNVWRFNRLTTQ